MSFPTEEYVDRLEADARSLTEGVRLIAAERSRQIDRENYDEGHDAAHDYGELTSAAVSYLRWALSDSLPEILGQNWPWDRHEFKPSDDPIRNLVRAGALVAAEIDRLLRETELKGNESAKGGSV